MRIGKFRVQNQPELWIIFDLTITEPHRATLLDGVSTDDRIKNWIDRLVDVFKQDGVTGYDRSLNHVQIILLSESDDKQLRVAAWTGAFSQRRIPCLKL